MIAVFGEGRGFRVVWLLEEMRLAYRLRDVNLAAGLDDDAEFLAINPAGFIPAIVGGDVTMVKSIAIMEFFWGAMGPRRWRPGRGTPHFPPISSSFTWERPGSPPLFILSRAPATSHRKTSATIGAPGRRWGCSRPGWPW
jgi:hypothetical protein